MTTTLPKRLAPRAVAELAGVTASTARRWCENGELPAEKIGGRWYVQTGLIRLRHPDLWSELLERLAEREAEA